MDPSVLVFLLLVSHQALGQTCGDLTVNVAAGQSLLQARSVRTPSKKSIKSARDILPQELLDLGLSVFGDEAKLHEVVTESHEINISYGGVPMILRILANDTAEERLPAENGSDYGLDADGEDVIRWKLTKGMFNMIENTFGNEIKDMFNMIESILANDITEQPLGSPAGNGSDYRLESDGVDMLLQEHRTGTKDMVNIIDMGANYGAVAISVFKRFPGLVRVVAVEPIAETYFFLRWNLWLNNISHLSDKAWQSSSGAGAAALHAAVTKKAGEDVQMCSHPLWSMNAQASWKDCDCSIYRCTVVQGVSTESLIDAYFDKEEITLLKIDCEGCEFHVLPAIASHPSQIKHLVGELHLPEEDLIDIACAYEKGKYMTMVCRLNETSWSAGLPLDCKPDRKTCAW